jgi:hypothetical protein
MISPLGQRQIFQTANVEAVRQAHEVSGEIQREIMKAKTAEERLVEDQSTVRLIPEFERILAEERKGGREQQEADHQPSGNASESEAKEEPDSAADADSRLDFLA